MPLTLEQAQFHVPRFKFRQELSVVSPNDRGASKKNDSFAGHYSVGTPTYASPHYSGSVTYDKASDTATFVQTLRLADKGSGLWGRNTNCLSFAMAAMGDIRDTYGQRIGIYKPALPQLFLFAYTFAALSGCLGIPLGTKDAPATVQKPKMATDEYNDNIWVVPGEYIQAPTYEDHCWYAHQDGYYPDRSDIAPYNETVKTLMFQFRQWIEAKQIPNRFIGVMV